MWSISFTNERKEKLAFEKKPDVTVLEEEMTGEGNVSS
jgi:hypothetical protein